jgi:hypothetical protein
MKTTYLKDGVKYGFIITRVPAPWYVSVDAFKDNETNIINGFVTGKDIDFNLLALYQRCGVLYRNQELVINECDEIVLFGMSKQIDNFKAGQVQNIYIPNELDFIHRKLFKVDNKTKDSKDKIIQIVKTILNFK